MPQAARAIIAVAIAQIIWGFTTPALKIALTEIPPFSAIFIRFAIATVLAAPFFFGKPYQRIDGKDLLKLALISVFGLALHMAFFVVGLSLTKVVVASLIIALAPIVSSVAAVVFLKEKVKFVQTIGILIGLCGTLILILQPVALGNQGLSFDLVGTMLILASIVFSTVFVIGSKELFSRYSPMTVSFYAFFFTSIIFLPFTLFEAADSNWVGSLTFLPAAAIVFSGVFASFAAYLLFEWGLSRSQVETIVPLTYLTPVISFMAGVLLFNEVVDAWILASTLVILLGVWLATIKGSHHHLHTKHHT